MEKFPDTMNRLLLLTLFLTSLLHAETLIHNDGFTGNNADLPGPSEGWRYYGSHTASSDSNRTATEGAWGVTGTPDITLHWTTGNFDTYTGWDGRGSVIQLDSSNGGTRNFAITFTPTSSTGVRISSFELDAYSGGPVPTKKVTWRITDDNGQTLHPGGNWEMSAGRGAPISPLYSGAIGQTLILRLDFTEGSGDYLALDNLKFDQITAGVTPPPSLFLNKTSFLKGEPITATFAHGPGGASDWIGIYPQGVTPSGNPASTAWYYTNGSRTVGGSLTDGNVAFSTTSISPGQYNAWFLQNGGYTQLADPVPFTIDGSNPPVWLVATIRPRHFVTGQPLSGPLSPYISLANGPYTFEKTAGPAWLSVSPDGTWSGTPGSNDAGLNTFTIRATGSITGLFADVPLEIRVFPPGQESVTHLAVMSYNVWLQWGQINGGIRKGIESIARSGADVVGFQESSDSHAIDAANALGWYRAASGSGDKQLISRYPIVETFTAGNAIGARIRITDNPRRDVIVYSCHLHYQNYAPYAAELPNATEASVLAEESTQRINQMQAILSGISSQLADSHNIPVFLTGDFNCPSHLDWTVETAPIHNNVGSVAWPVSIAVDQAGMLDSYRVAHPDPLASPGNTWSTVYKGTEPQDRIDFIYFKGSPAKALSSEVFTTEVEGTTGRWGTSLTSVRNNTWPSDHAAVVSIFSLSPVDSDANNLPDAWENRWFGSIGNNPGEISSSNGLNHAAALLFGLPPVGSVPAPLSLLAGNGVPSRQLDFPLSEFALGRGFHIQRSTNLDNWETLWSFDADPFLSSPSIQVTPSPTGGAWNIRIPDHSTSPKGFFRARWNP